MTLKLIALLTEAEKTLEREIIEARLTALHDLRWEICRILDDLIANEEQRLKGQDLGDEDL